MFEAASLSLPSILHHWARSNLLEDNNSDQDVMSTRRLESDAGDNLENDDNSHIFGTFCLISGPCPLLLALLKSLGTEHAMQRQRSHGWVGSKNKNKQIGEGGMPKQLIKVCTFEENSRIISGLLSFWTNKTRYSTAFCWSLSRLLSCV